MACLRRLGRRNVDLFGIGVEDVVNVRAGRLRQDRAHEVRTQGDVSVSSRETGEGSELTCLFPIEESIPKGEVQYEQD